MATAAWIPLLYGGAVLAGVCVGCVLLYLRCGSERPATYSDDYWRDQ